MPSVDSKSPSGAEEEEDDYLTMTFEDPPAPSATAKGETLTQARKRKLLHAETAGRPKSKAELAAEEARRREEGLAKKLDDASNAADTNKGLRMMQKLGYVPGSALGVQRAGEEKARVEPIHLAMKDDRSGIGRESETKRKIREAAERELGEAKRQKVDEGYFVDRVRAEREEKRLEGQIVGAQKVCERLEEEEEEDGTVDAEKTRRTRKFTVIPVLWRGLIKRRELDEREKRQRHEIYTSLQQSRTHENDSNGDNDIDDDPDFDEHDKLALPPLPGPHHSTNTDPKLLIETDDSDLDSDDPDLEAFESLPAAERLEQLVLFLRGKYRYCFWCKYRYGDEEAMREGCPGVGEDQHG